MIVTTGVILAVKFWHCLQFVVEDPAELVFLLDLPSLWNCCVMLSFSAFLQLRSRLPFRLRLLLFKVSSASVVLRIRRVRLGLPGNGELRHCHTLR